MRPCSLGASFNLSSMAATFMSGTRRVVVGFPLAGLGTVAQERAVAVGLGIPAAVYGVDHVFLDERPLFEKGFSVAIGVPFELFMHEQERIEPLGLSPPDLLAVESLAGK